MRTGAKFFVLSAAFAAVIGTAYWFVAYEPAGTALLGSLAVAPLLVAGYLLRLSRDGRPPEDRPEAPPSAGRGRSLGPFVPASAWPAIVAAGAMLVAGGLAYGPWLLAVGAVALALGLIGLARE